MQRYSTTLFAIFAFVSFFSFTNLTAQTSYKTSDVTPVLNVTGTSTLHGWTVAINTVSDLPTSLVLNLENGKSINNFSFGVPISDMDGGRGASMNAKITGALKASNHPTITYQQKEPAIIQGLDSEGNFKMISKGTLNIVGQEKEIEIEVVGQKTTEGQLILKGSKPMKFSDFDIEPPSAMFGQIICGDDIAVNFEFVYQVE